MEDMGIVVVALAATFGGVLSALMGWWDSKEPFDSRKFSRSVVVALLSGMAFAISYSFAGDVSIKDIFLAIMSGAGIDSLTNRALGATTKG